METCLRKINNKKAYRLVNYLTTEKLINQLPYKTFQGSASQRSLRYIWTEHSNLYNAEADGDPAVLDCQHIPDEEPLPILQEEVEAAVKTLKMGKSA